MGYQALLFCPDEKTARTVTQVLSELDFTVAPCTEPFAAVKKLMAEHFDAVVVDCDNEQNATLLFRSARNSPNNQSSLAVAVVEGQAGVAKAFRIGANLVLTKPINVEQAKGTLRVARGLLRKNETAKPATPAAGTAVKPAAPVPAPPKLVQPTATPSLTAARPAAPITPLATPKAAPPQPKVVAFVPTASAEPDIDLFELIEEEPSIAKPAAQTSAPKIISAAPATPKIETAASHPVISAPTSSVSSASPAGMGKGAASAPAPAREPKPSAPVADKTSTFAEPASPVEKLAEFSVDASSDAAAAPGTTFTFGGNVSGGGATKKALLAVAAVVVIAAVGYAVWMQWVRSSGAEVNPVRVTSQPATAPATVPQTAPNRAPVATSSGAPSAASPAPPSTSGSAGASQPTGTAKTIADAQPATVESAPVHSSKDSSKPSPSAVAENKTPAPKAAAQPIVIKNNVSRPTANPTATTDAPAPSLAGIASAGNTGALPNLMGGESKAPAPVLQTLNVSQGVSQGLLLKKIQPTYPPTALRMRIEGAVQLMATISKNGNISAVKILSGDPQLARAAADAVKQWKYKPYQLNGEPVEIQTPVTVNFKLPN
jgi:periplasmic protein TonB